MNHNFYHIVHHNQSSAVWVMLAVFAIPWISLMVYAFSINILKIKFTKKSLIIYTIFMIVLTYTSFILCGEYLLPTGDPSKRIGLFIYITGVFIFSSQIHMYYFHKAWISDDKLFMSIYDPKDASDVIIYSKAPTAIRFVGFISRYSMFAGLILAIFAALFDAAEIEALHNLPVYLIFCSAGMAAIFIFSMGVLRVFAKCDNCNLELYPLDRDLNAYFDVAKHAVKDKIIKCMRCHATLVLDPEINLDIAKIRAEEIDKKRKIIQQTLDRFRK